MRRAVFHILTAGIVFSLSHGVISAQVWGMITGRVMTRLERRLLPDLSVELERMESGQKYHALTDEQGRFAFQRLSPGRYRLTIAPPGFRPERRIVQLAPREVLVLDFLLDVEPLRQELTVESERSLPVGAQTRGTFLQEGQIAMLPRPKQVHLPEIIAALVPHATRSHDDLVHVRGTELSLHTVLNGVFFWENPHTLFSAGLDPGIIESVTVLTGPFSAEYGNRFGGVLDIVTKSGLGRSAGGSLLLNMGNSLRHHTALEYGGHQGKWGYYVRSLGFQSARFLSPPEPDAHHDVGRGLRNFLQFDVQPSARDLFRFTLMGNGVNFEIPNTIEQQQFGRDLRQHAREQTFIAVWERFLSPRTEMHTAFYQRFSRAKLLPSLDARSLRTWFTRRLDTLGVKADVQHTVSSHVLKAGFDVVSLRPHEVLSMDPSAYEHHCEHHGDPCMEFERVDWQARTHGRHVSAYVQDRFSLLPGMVWEIGIRVDAHRVITSSVGWSPRVGVFFLIPKIGWGLHLSYNRFFIPPPLEAILLSSAAPGIFIRDYAAYSAHPLLPETAHQFDVGLTRTLAEDIRIRIAAFRRTGRRPVHTVQFPEAWIFPYVNFDRERVMGVDLSIEVPFLRRVGLSGFLNYSASRAYYWNPARGGFTAAADGHEGGRFLAPFDQTHTGTAGVLWSFRRRVWIGTWFEYGSGTPIHAHGDEHGHGESGMAELSGSHPMRVPGHFIAHMGGGIELLRRSRFAVAWQWDCENLTDRRFVIARQSLFTPGQYALSRHVSTSLKLSF
jgi:hypothetical protein